MHSNDGISLEANNEQKMADLISISIAIGPMSLEQSTENASELVTESLYRVIQQYLLHFLRVPQVS